MRARVRDAGKCWPQLPFRSCWYITPANFVIWECWPPIARSFKFLGEARNLNFLMWNGKILKVGLNSSKILWIKLNMSVVLGWPANHRLVILLWIPVTILFCVTSIQHQKLTYVKNNHYTFLEYIFTWLKKNPLSKNNSKGFEMTCEILEARGRCF